MNPLETQLIHRINRDGPITFRDFMEAALYDPTHGYYNTPRPKIGAGGDYYTSSNVHRAFGEILARAFVQLWTGAGYSISEFTIVEIGAGTGQLARDILESLETLNYEPDGLRYVIVERSSAMHSLQTEILAPFRTRIDWVSIDDLAGPLDGIIFSNELFDSLPVHRARRSLNGWQEQYLDVSIESPNSRRSEGGRLTTRWDELSTDRLYDYLESYGEWITEDQIVEVNLEALELLTRLSDAMARGFLVTIDYGDTAERLYSSSRHEGTIRSFYRHTVTSDVLDQPGGQDITASVNFTALIDQGRRLGLELVSLERQTSFLLRTGLAEIAARATEDQASDLAGRLALKNLFIPGGISDHFNVLVQKKSGDRRSSTAII